jgi:hypothetical protein
MYIYPRIVRFEVFTAVTMKNGVFWDITPGSSSSGILHRVALARNYVSEELYTSIIRVTKICEVRTMLVVTGVRRLLVTANVVPSSPILVILMIKALSSSETSVLTIATRHNIPEDAILLSKHRQRLQHKFCIREDAYVKLQMGII